MAKLFYFLFCGFLMSCGSSSDPAKDGSDGVDGKSPKCVVVEKEGVKYLKCLNADGSVSETVLPVPEDGVDGSDGSDALLGYTSCAVDWPHEAGRGYKINYNVAYLAGDLVLASMNYSYYGNGTQDFLTNFSVVHTKESQGLTTAKLGNNLWDAYLVGKDKAKLTYKPLSQSKDVVCKYTAH